MNRKYIIPKRRNSLETLERYPESKDKIIQFQTVAQSVRSEISDNTRSKTLNKITGELIHGLFVR